MKTSLNLQGIIFDLDGTLGNTLPICFTAFKSAFLKYLNRNFTDLVWLG
jgi:pyrophosphatase PpaX